jgi:hypothetical protein
MDAEALQVAEMEYTTLRNEILKRVELRHQIVSVALTLAGIFLAVGLTKDLVALIYPPLAACLALAWIQNDFRTRYAANYICENIESCVRGLNYETWVRKARETGGWGLGSSRLVVLSHGGIFVFTQLMALGIELSRFTPFTPLKWLLLGFDLIAVSMVILIIAKATRWRRGKAK